jgi:hypothetical protein
MSEELEIALIPLRLFGMMFGFILLLILIGCISSLFKDRKSQNYRKLIMDLYVAGKTKLLAKADNIDIDEEYKDYLKWNKKIRKEERNSRIGTDLDNIIEDEMKEKVSETINDNIDKSEKKK